MNLCIVYRRSFFFFSAGWSLGVVCHCWDTEAASYDFQLRDFGHFSSKWSSFKSSGVFQWVVDTVRLCVQLPPAPPPIQTKERAERKYEGYNRGGQQMWMTPHLLEFLVPPLPAVPNPSCFSIDHPCNRGKALRFSNVSAPLAPSPLCPENGGGSGRL